MDKEILELNRVASKKKEVFYIDPKTGFRVFTEYYLKNRGWCCNTGCRHCPWREKSEK